MPDLSDLSDPSDLCAKCTKAVEPYGLNVTRYRIAT